MLFIMLFQMVQNRVNDIGNVLPIAHGLFASGEFASVDDLIS